MIDGKAVPTTSEDRLVRAIGHYNALDATVRTAVLNGSLRGAHATQVKVVLGALRDGLNLWSLSPKDGTAEQKVLVALQAAQVLISNILRPGTSPPIEPPRPVSLMMEVYLV